jgi:branched-chain amino acid transport system substrate-binding protein
VRHRPLAATLLLPLLGAVALAGCAKDNNTNGGGGGGTNAASCTKGADIKAAASSGGGAASSSSAPTTGSGTATPNGKTYTIGAILPQSGPNAQLGLNESNSVQLAIELANKSGKYPFQLKYAISDDEGDQAKAPAAAQKLIDQKDIVAAVGPAFSGVTKNAQPKFNDAHLASVSPSATNPDLSKNNWSTFFRVVPPDDAQGVEAAKFLEKYSKKVYLVDDKSEYGVGLSKVIEDQLKKDNITVVKDGIEAGSTDYSGIATKVKGSGATALYYAGYYSDLAKFAKALQSAGYDCLSMSGDGSNDDQLVALGGSAAENWLLTCPCSDSKLIPGGQDFVAAYKAKWNTDPSTYSAEAFDATNAIIEAINSVQGEVTRESVLAAIKAVSYQGLTVNVKFSATGEVEGGKVNVFKVASGKRDLLGSTTDLLK